MKQLLFFYIILITTLTSCHKEEEVVAQADQVSASDSTKAAAANLPIGDTYSAMIDSISVEGQLVAQLPDDPKVRPIRMINGKPALLLEDGKIVMIADGQAGAVTVSNGKMMMQLRDSSLKEITVKKDEMSLNGKSVPDARMAVMMQGKMLDVTLLNGKKIVTMPDSTRMELTINNGQQVLIPADSTIPKNTMLRLQNGTLRPVKLDSGKLRMQVQTNKSVELQKKETAVSPASK